MPAPEYAGFRIADDAVVEVDQVGAEEWGQREDDRGGVAAGVGDESCRGDGGGVELGGAVDGFGLERGGGFGVGVVEFVYCSVGLLLETPGSAEVNDADACSDGCGDVFARLLMRGGEEEDVDGFLFQELPVEGDNAERVGVGQAGELGVQAGKCNGVRACAA